MQSFRGLEMASYTDADKIMDVDTLIGHVKKLGGYVEEETDNTLVKIEKGHAAVLWQGDKNLGAFLIFDKVRICIRPYFFDAYEEGAVGTRQKHSVPLAYENLGVEQRVELFNKNAQEFYKSGIAEGFKLAAPYVIKDLKPFKMKNAAGNKAA